MKKTLLIILAFAGVFTACEDPVDVKVPAGKSYPVLDAWISNVKGPQHINLTQSVPYLDQTAAPVISDATVTLYDVTAGKTYPFAYANGKYTYDPGADNSIGVIGHAYMLKVQYKGELFEAYDTIRRVPPIDSITYEFKKEGESTSGKEGYYARWHGTDPEGRYDYYWIRSYRNSKDNRLRDLYSVDGSYAEDISDGFRFITPLSESITDYDKPFKQKEKVIVRLRSLTKGSFEFLKHVESQLDNGGLFARVLENVKSNMVNKSANGKERILGYFGASGEVTAEKTIQ